MKHTSFLVTSFIFLVSTGIVHAAESGPYPRIEDIPQNKWCIGVRDAANPSYVCGDSLSECQTIAAGESGVVSGCALYNATAPPPPPPPPPSTQAINEGFVPLAPIPGLTEGVSPTQQGIAVFLNNLYIFLIGIAVVLAIGMIIWGGFEYALSEAIPGKSAGREKITNALFGLVLVLAPALVFYIINPAILNLSVNFPPLETKWGDYKPSTGGEKTSLGGLGGGYKTTYTCGDNGCASAISACKDSTRTLLYFGYQKKCYCVDSGGTEYRSSTDACKSGEQFHWYTDN